MIDPHVHCRDWNQSYKETIEHALHVAEKVGLSAIFDMPNTDPAIISRETVERRLADAEKCKSKVFYGLYIGLTSDENQIKEAVGLWKEYFPRVVGLKMFTSKSGSLGIIKEDEQRFVYQTLAKCNYGGVLAVHCEKESLLKSVFDPENPRTWSFARPPESEVESVKDQIKFAEEVEYEGGLHICHVSVPDSINYIGDARAKINITCGVTPHHCLLNYEMIPESKEGLIYKVNPPLRSRRMADEMFRLLNMGGVDFIETDHAPHTLEDKLKMHMSGFHGLPNYPNFVNYLRFNEDERIDFYEFPEKQIQELTHTNIEEIFNIKIPLLNNQPDFNLDKEYGFDVYKILK